MTYFELLKNPLFISEIKNAIMNLNAAIKCVEEAMWCADVVDENGDFVDSEIENLYTHLGMTIRDGIIESAEELRFIIKE